MFQIINISLTFIVIGQLFSFTTPGRISFLETTTPIVDENGKHSILVEGDMLLSPKQWTMVFLTTQHNFRKVRKRNLISLADIWPNGEIPITFKEGDFSETQKAIIMNAFSKWSKYACVKARDRKNNESHYVEIVNSQNGCASKIGNRKTKQQLRLNSQSCLAHGIPEHEIGHLLGKFHEHIAYDRDEYITIHQGNILPSRLSLFTRMFPPTDANIQFDIRSIMHYRSGTFSANKKKTITTNKYQYQWIIDKTEKQISFYDLKAINWLYKCSSHCSPKIKCPPFGFVGSDCKCKCPVSTYVSLPTKAAVRECTKHEIDTSLSRTCYDRNTYCHKFPRDQFLLVCLLFPHFAINCRLSCLACDNKKDPVFTECKDKLGCVKHKPYCNYKIQKYMCPVTCGICTP